MIKVKKTLLASSILLLSALVGCVNAQESVTPIPTSPPEPNPFGAALAIVGLTIVFAIILFAGYKLLRKYSRGGGESG